MKNVVSKTSILGRYVNIGKNTKIWHFCNIYGTEDDPVVIGENTQIGSYCEIKFGSKIGNGCRFQSFVFVPEKSIIGNNVFIGPRVTFLNEKYPTAKKVLEKTYIVEPIEVKDDVTIGGGSTILPGVVVGRGSVIGAGAVITKNVPEYSVVVGNPAKVIGSVLEKRFAKFDIKKHQK